MGTWQLFTSNSDEIEAMDTVSLQTNKFEEAHTYFRLRKNLDSNTFNKLFIVKEYVKPKTVTGEVDWWKSEATKLDDF